MTAPMTFVVIPTFNEAENIGLLIQDILGLPHDLGVIVVDDASPDGTGEIAESFAVREPERVRVIHRPAKLGLGTAYLAGFDLAFSHAETTRVMTMDADYSHDPSYIPDMLALADRIHIVIGSRYISGGGTRNWPMSRRFLSRTANLVARVTLGLKAWDATAGFRVYRREVFEAVPPAQVRSQGYSFLVEMLFRCQRAGFRIGEVPIVFTDRQRGVSKISRKEVLAAQLTILRLLWQRITGKIPQRSVAPPAR